MRIIFVGLILCLSFSSLYAQELDSSSSPEVNTAVDNESGDAESGLVERDPFASNLEEGVPQRVSSVGGTSLGAEPELQGLAIKGDKASAVINGKTYNQGDEARGGIQVIEVRKGEVDIKWGGVNKTLRFLPKKKEAKKRLQTPGMGASQTIPMSGYSGPEPVGTISGNNPAPLEDSK